MLIKDFWEIIDKSYKGSEGIQEKQVELLKAALEEETSDTIKRYCIYLMGLLKRASTEEFWACYYLINGGYEEWGFEDFRYWVIAHGKEFWEATLENPVEFLYNNVNIKIGDNPDVTFYEFWAAFKNAYEEKSDNELNHSFEWMKVYEEVQKAELELEKIMRPKAHDYEIRKQYPELYNKFFQNYYYLLKKYQEKKKTQEKEVRD
jgi:hypothetical protein